MPNWCHNKLIIEGNEKDVHSWVERGSSLDRTNPDVDIQPLHMEAFCPPPKSVLNGSEDLIDWRIKNWGTKWDVSFSADISSEGGGFEREEGVARYYFDTPWGPPVAWIESIASQYPTLSFRFTYGEPGMDFGGEIVCENGKVIKDIEGTATDYLEDAEMWF